MYDMPHGQTRLVKKLQARTPLIVPSFSSRGFPQVGDILSVMKHRLYGVCLVSALDVSSGCIPANIADDVNLVIFDSGKYECSGSAGESIGYTASRSSIDWTKKLYHSVASNIDQTANAILVNFDSVGPIDWQITQASEDFAHAPRAAKDFLVKPEQASQTVNIAKLAIQTDALRQFDIVGVTARESAASLINRCRTVVMLRNALTDAGLSLPIHIFGAIKPAEVLTYFFCGADIFDGLNWLRLSFRDHGSHPVEDAAFEPMKWVLQDVDLLVSEWSANLAFLYRLQESLQRYGFAHDFNELIKEFPSAQQFARIAEMAGAVVPFK